MRSDFVPGTPCPSASNERDCGLIEFSTPEETATSLSSGAAVPSSSCPLPPQVPFAGPLCAGRLEKGGGSVRGTVGRRFLDLERADEALRRSMGRAAPYFPVSRRTVFTFRSSRRNVLFHRKDRPDWRWSIVPSKPALARGPQNSVFVCRTLMPGINAGFP